MVSGISIMSLFSALYLLMEYWTLPLDLMITFKGSWMTSVVLLWKLIRNP